MAGIIQIVKLRPHPKNNYYFSDLESTRYEEIKRSIATYGIRSPLKVTTNYIVVSGHQRLKIAKDLGLDTVPVSIVDVDEKEAEYLLIAENVERRGEVELDPIRKARIAGFLKEYWTAKNEFITSRGNAHNGHLKTQSSIAKIIGETRQTTQRLIKLNDLIPELQQLISTGKLGTTAGEQLAHLTQETQKTLWETIGVNIGSKTVAEVKNLRRQINVQESQISRLQTDLERTRREVGQKPEIVEKVIEKAPPDYDDLKKQLRKLKKENEEANLELLGLTREQVEQKDCYWVRDEIINIAQDVGRHIIKLRYEIGRRSINASAYNDIMELVDLLAKITDELRKTAEQARNIQYNYIDV